jgi:hypothetical protein
MGNVNDRAARFLIAALDNSKKMFSSLLAEGAGAFRNRSSGDGNVVSADLALRQVSAFWENLVETKLLDVSGAWPGRSGFRLFDGFTKGFALRFVRNNRASA